jgi:RNA polymerase sigma factor (sigma-70 family)
LDRSEKRLETKLRVEQAIRLLGDDERKVFELVKLEGYSEVEAAEKLGISQATVSRRYVSARDMLRNILGQK